MAAKRRIEVFSAGCAVCEGTAARIKDIARPSCEVVILDMADRAAIITLTNPGPISA